MFPVCILKNTYILVSQTETRLTVFRDVQSLSKGKDQKKSLADLKARSHILSYCCWQYIWLNKALSWVRLLVAYASEETDA